MYHYCSSGSFSPPCNVASFTCAWYVRSSTHVLMPFCFRLLQFFHQIFKVMTTSHQSACRASWVFCARDIQVGAHSYVQFACVLFSCAMKTYAYIVPHTYAYICTYSTYMHAYQFCWLLICTVFEWVTTYGGHLLSAESLIISLLPVCIILWYCLTPAHPCAQCQISSRGFNGRICKTNCSALEKHHCTCFRYLSSV